MFNKKIIIGILLATILLISGLGIFKSLNAAKQDQGIIVQPIAGPSVADKLVNRSKSSWPWYLARGSGIVAGVSLIILMISGIGSITGFTFKLWEPLTAWATHRALGIAFGVSVLVHMFSLLFDKFVPFNLWQLLVPWMSDFKPVIIWGHQLGSLYVALGVLSFYGSLFIVLSSLVWVEKKPYIWKLLHLLSYIVIVFIFIHALYLGTDLAHGLLRWLWIIFGVSTGILMLQRLWRAKTV